MLFIIIASSTNRLTDEGNTSIIVRRVQYPVTFAITEAVRKRFCNNSNSIKNNVHKVSMVTNKRFRAAITATVGRRPVTGHDNETLPDSNRAANLTSTGKFLTR